MTPRKINADTVAEAESAITAFTERAKTWEDVGKMIGRGHMFEMLPPGAFIGTEINHRSPRHRAVLRWAIKRFVNTWECHRKAQLVKGVVSRAIDELQREVGCSRKEAGWHIFRTVGGRYNELEGLL